MSEKVITRFAPSPTGFMHIGGVRTALFAWLWARKNNGIFILRIEDTDKKREVAGSIGHIIASLKWLGIDWDEGPDIGGRHEPYKQSERLDTYKKYANTLVEKGLAYADPYSEEEVTSFRKKAEEEKRPFLYRMHRPENPPVWDGTKPLRLKTNVKKYKWNDIVRGDLEAGEEALDDFVLIKSDGYPTYNFAHIIDDLLMEVTHIFRADEFISSTPNYLALYEALGIKRPEFATLPPILGEAGTKKLGKRDGAKDILDYEKEGYLAEAMLNFLALIGWNPGKGDNREVMSKKDILESFDLKHIQKAGARFNEEKLDWINKEYIDKLTNTEFTEKAKNILDPKIKKLKNPKDELEFDTFVLQFKGGISAFGELNKLMLDEITDTSSSSENEQEEEPMMKTSRTSINISGSNDYLFPSKHPSIVEVIKLLDVIGNVEKNKIITEYLNKSKEKLEKGDWEKMIEKNDKNDLWIYASQEGKGKVGKVLGALRFVLSGRANSKGTFEIMKAIGKDSSLQRIERVLEILKSPPIDINYFESEAGTETKAYHESQALTFTSSK